MPDPVQPTRSNVSSSVERGTLKVRHTAALLAPPSRAAVICSIVSGSSAWGDSPPFSKWVFRGLGLFGWQGSDEGSLGLEHGAGDPNEAVGDGSERAAMTVA